MAVILRTGQSGQSAELFADYFDRFPGAIVRALNRAGVSTRTLMASRVADDMKLRVGTVRDQLILDRASRGKPQVRISVSGKRIPLYAFGARGPYPSRGRGRGVTARLPAPGRGRYPHAFIATMRSGHVGVFQRRGRDRLPIDELHGPSLPHVFAKFSAEGLARGQESLLKNLQSELQFALSK